MATPSIPLSQTGIFQRRQRQGFSPPIQGPVAPGGNVFQFRTTGTGGAPTGGVLGVSTGPSAPSAGQAPAGPAAPSAPSNLLLPTPGGPALPDNSAALAALGRREGDIGAARGLAQQEIQSAAGRARTTVEQGRERQLGELGQQEVREKQRGESAIAEARRQASELQQGIQSRFGGTTGTGQFASEILGREALGNIAGNRQILNQTLTELEGERRSVEQEAATNLQQIEEQTQLDIERSRQFFEQQLTEVAGLRGELESRKSEFRTRALQDHQARLDAINANNIEFKRGLFADFQQRQQQLQTAANREVQQFQASLTPAQFLESVRLGADVGSFPQGAIPGTLQGVRFGTGEEEEEQSALGQLQSLVQ